MSQHTCSAGITDSGDIKFIPVGFNPWTDLEPGDCHDNFCAFTHCPWCGKSVENEARAIGKLIQEHHDRRDSTPGVWWPIRFYHPEKPHHDTVLLWDGERFHLGHYSPDLESFTDGAKLILEPKWYLVPGAPDES